MLDPSSATSTEFRFTFVENCPACQTGPFANGMHQFERPVVCHSFKFKMGHIIFKNVPIWRICKASHLERHIRFTDWRERLARSVTNGQRPKISNFELPDSVSGPQPAQRQITTGYKCFKMNTLSFDLFIFLIWCEGVSIFSRWVREIMARGVWERKEKNSLDCKIGNWRKPFSLFNHIYILLWFAHNKCPFTVP